MLLHRRERPCFFPVEAEHSAPSKTSRFRPTYGGLRPCLPRPLPVSPGIPRRIESIASRPPPRAQSPLPVDARLPPPPWPPIEAIAPSKPHFPQRPRHSPLGAYLP